MMGKWFPEPCVKGVTTLGLSVLFWVRSCIEISCVKNHGGIQLCLTLFLLLPFTQTYVLCNTVLQWVTQVTLFILWKIACTKLAGRYYSVSVFVVVWERGIIISYLSLINTLFQILLRRSFQGWDGAWGPSSGNSGDSVLQQEGCLWNLQPKISTLWHASFE